MRRVTRTCTGNGRWREKWWRRRLRRRDSIKCVESLCTISGSIVAINNDVGADTICTATCATTANDYCADWSADAPTFTDAAAGGAAWSDAIRCVCAGDDDQWRSTEAVRPKSWCVAADESAFRTHCPGCDALLCVISSGPHAITARVDRAGAR